MIEVIHGDGVGHHFTQAPELLSFGIVYDVPGQRKLDLLFRVARCQITILAAFNTLRSIGSAATTCDKYEAMRPAG